MEGALRRPPGPAEGEPVRVGSTEYGHGFVGGEVAAVVLQPIELQDSSGCWCFRRSTRLTAGARKVKCRRMVSGDD